MSDGISDMYYAQEESEKARLFIRTLAQYVIQNHSIDSKLVDMALNAGRFSRDLLGDFGWHESYKKSCRNKLNSCMKRLRSLDKSEWALFLRLYLREMYTGKEWDSLLEVSPFKGQQVALVSRSGGEMRVGAGLSSFLWSKSKDIEHYGLAVFPIKDVEIITVPEERCKAY